jgi:hypothetical protein
MTQHAHDYGESWRCVVPGCGYELPSQFHQDRTLGKTEQGQTQ